MGRPALRIATHRARWRRRPTLPLARPAPGPRPAQRGNAPSPATHRRRPRAHRSTPRCAEFRRKSRRVPRCFGVAGRSARAGAGRGGRVVEARKPPVVEWGGFAWQGWAGVAEQMEGAQPSLSAVYFNSASSPNSLIWSAKKVRMTIRPKPHSIYRSLRRKRTL